MLGASGSPGERRSELAGLLSAGGLLRFVGAVSPLSALLVAGAGFEGVYVSGAVVAAGLGLPDIGLTTSTEVAGFTRQVTAVAPLPCLVDADTGFGEPVSTARTVQQLEDAGAAGCHLEDQVLLKRCGHLEGKTLVPVAEMGRRLAAALRARRDPGFLVCARTDARTVEGLQPALERARAYVDGGAEMIFAEAVESAAEIEAFRRAVEVPLLVNMTEFGRSPLLGASTLASLGVNVVLYPVTLLRLAMGAVEAGLARLAAEGTQAGLVDSMQTRARLYEVLDYASYDVFDEALCNFEMPTGGGADGR